MRERIERWASANLEALKGAEPDLPDERNDRAQDAWEALFAIADLVGGDWPRTARRASIAVSGGDAGTDDSLGVRLLEDIRRIFGRRGTDRITTADLVADLVSDEESPWVEFRKGKPITAAGLARLLKPFGISSRTICVVGTTIRGFVNGRMVVEADDATFQAGGAGLWTKADSVTCFDDVTVGPVSGP
ncbi:MAG: DUF3631 domain-containing protein [Chloroflexota bacterium]|nr:DUF3631 domain-containing protein [Chloroflexota bacterium]